jgi:hypothetical protein
MSEQRALLIHILEKVDKIQEDVYVTRESQVRMEADVKYHIKRTDMLEDQVKKNSAVIRWLAVPIDLLRCVLQWLKLMK